CSTRIVPRITIVTSSKTGRWNGSSQPGGATMCATLSAAVPVLARPTCSSMTFAPGAGMRTGSVMGRTGIGGGAGDGTTWGRPAGRPHRITNLTARSAGGPRSVADDLGERGVEDVEPGVEPGAVDGEGGAEADRSLAAAEDDEPALEG